MKTVVTETQILDLENYIHRAIFPTETKGGGIVMCNVIPSRGVFVAGKFTRAFRECNQPAVDMTEFFEELKMKDFQAFRAALCYKSECESLGRRE